MQFSNTVTIERPVADVFAYLARLENLPQWNYAISETRQVSGGSVGVGTRYTQTRRLPSHSSEEVAVVAYESERQLVLRGTFGPFQGSARYVLEPLGNATRLVNDMELEASGVMRLVAPLAAARVKAAVAANLDVLKQVLEAR